MTKAELQKALEDAGEKVDRRWNEAKLQAKFDALAVAPEAENVDTTPTYSEVEIAAIEEDLSGVNARPIEELKAKVERNHAGQLQTAAGLLVPDSVFTKAKKTGWTYRIRTAHNVCIVEKVMYNGRVEFVREYSMSVHGNDYAALAGQFVFKKNEL